MPVRGATAKQNRQYEHIKASAKKKGRSTKRAKQIAARTVNKQKSQGKNTSANRKGSASAKRSRSRK